MGRSEKLNQGGATGKHSPDSLVSGPGGSVGGQHSPKDPQNAEDKGLNDLKSRGGNTSKKTEK